MSECTNKIDVPKPFSDALHLMSLKCFSGLNPINLTNEAVSWLGEKAATLKFSGSLSKIQLNLVN